MDHSTLKLRPSRRPAAYTVGRAINASQSFATIARSWLCDGLLDQSRATRSIGPKSLIAERDKLNQLYAAFRSHHVAKTVCRSGLGRSCIHHLR